MALVGAVAVGLLELRRRGMQRIGWALLGSAILAGLLGGWSNALTIGLP